MKISVLTQTPRLLIIEFSTQQERWKDLNNRVLDAFPPLSAVPRWNAENSVLSVTLFPPQDEEKIIEFAESCVGPALVEGTYRIE